MIWRSKIKIQLLVSCSLKRCSFCSSQCCTFQWKGSKLINRVWIQNFWHTDIDHFFQSASMWGGRRGGKNFKMVFVCFVLDERDTLLIRDPNAALYCALLSSPPGVHNWFVCSFCSLVTTRVFTIPYGKRNNRRAWPCGGADIYTMQFHSPEIIYRNVWAWLLFPISQRGMKAETNLDTYKYLKSEIFIYIGWRLEGKGCGGK